ncbi:MAG: hypothetical protein HWN66_03895 [Candidatus Helarchaeota archaeon]|nr:hypothetical protein [Candidatus Helarchaeota archaeon]
MVLDIADSKDALSKLGKSKYTEWLGLGLHCLFHCVDDYKGTIDKYTGDGAMISFSIGTKEERCTNAKNCAVKISHILSKILNPYYKEMKYEIMNVRIGIDYGSLRIEKIGKKAKSQLIIIGSTANIAKSLEQAGKDLEFDQYTTICFGYDLLYNVPAKVVSSSVGEQLYHEILIGKYSGSSEMDNSKPYKVYQYTGRIRD